jgi:hypothetical protein
LNKIQAVTSMFLKRRFENKGKSKKSTRLHSEHLVGTS